MPESQDSMLVIGPGGSGKTHLLASLNSQGSTVALRLINNSPDDSNHCALADLLGLDSGVGARPLADAVAERIDDHGLVTADDAHRLDSMSLAALRLLATSGHRVVAAISPGPQNPEVADLVDALTKNRQANHIEPFDFDRLAKAIKEWTAAAPAAELVDQIRELSGGNPGLARDLVLEQFDGGDVLPSGVTGRISTRLARLRSQTAAVAAAIALTPTIADIAIADIAGCPIDALAGCIDELRAAGLVVADADQLVSVVARSLVQSWGPVELRRRHRLTASALQRIGEPSPAIAKHFRLAEVTGETAAELFIDAGDQLRWRNPIEAIEWYDHATRAGAPPSKTAIGRAEADLGIDGTDVRLLVEQFDREDPAQRARARLVLAAIDADDARPDRAAAQLLKTIDHPDHLTNVVSRLAVPLLVSVGKVDAARAIVDTEPVDDLDPTARFADLVATASIGAIDGADTVAGFVEAAELAESTNQRLPSIISAHSLAACHAELAGDFSAAESILTRSIDTEVGGQARILTHRLERAWLFFRQGRHDTGARLVQDLKAAPINPRNRLFLAAIDAGLARRSGDIARLNDSWNAVEEALVRQTADLTTFGPVGELVVAATRLGHHARADAVQVQLDALVEGFDTPPVTWVVAAAWHRVQLAITTESPATAAAAAAMLNALPASKLSSDPADTRPNLRSAVAAAANCWQEILGGEVDVERVNRTVDQIHAASLPWDAARLAGQAALRLTDANTSRALLERARDLKTPLPDNGGDRATESPLSDREQEVAVLVADGLTYKEIGAQLYISAKTVEHHVARIRRKLGAESRQEMLASIRELR